MRRHARLLAAGSLAAASVAVSACGSSEPPTILDTEKVERAIERSTLAQRKLRVHVTCPSGVHQKKGLVFDCTAIGPRDSRTRFVVTQEDDAGQVRYEAP